MMKDEIKRIMSLVQEGKLSPDDAAELIEAFETSGIEEEDQAAGETTPPPPPSEPQAPKPPEPPHKDNPFEGFFEEVEKIGKSVATSVNWNEIASQIRTGARKGVEALKVAAEQAKEGKFVFFGSCETREIKLPLTIDSNKTLRIENSSGDIRIVGGSAENAVDASVSVRGSDPEDAKAKAEQFTLVVEEGEHFVDIRQPDVSGVHMDLTVRLACSPAIEVKSKSGDVAVANTQSGCRIQGSSGDISLTGLNGAIEVATLSGDVSLKDSVASSLTLENKSGDVRLDNVKGNLRVSTASGDVVFERCSGRTISIDAVTGDVVVDLIEPVEGTVNVRTVQGDAQLAIPDGSNCRVALSTLRGDVSCTMELKDEAKLEQRVTGTLGEGAGTLDVSAVAGDVTLKQRAHTT